MERISLRGICRVLKISSYHLYKYVDELYKQVKSDLHDGYAHRIEALIKHSQDVDLQHFECDEAWSFVGNKSNKQWIWVALHRESGMIVGLFIGTRGEEGAQGHAIPEMIRKKAIFHTDDWEAYKKVFTEAQHRPSKKKGNQSY